MSVSQVGIITTSNLSQECTAYFIFLVFVSDGTARNLLEPNINVQKGFAFRTVKTVPQTET
jgi:hypothetical protein